MGRLTTTGSKVIILVIAIIIIIIIIGLSLQQLELINNHLKFTFVVRRQ
jgi:hypothetical protein